MDKRFGNYFLGKSHFSYMKYCFRNYFRNNFWLECALNRHFDLFGVSGSVGPLASQARITQRTEDLSAPKSQQFLRFAIAMPIADPRNSLAISETRESNAALRFKGAMESR